MPTLKRGREHTFEDTIREVRELREYDSEREAFDEMKYALLYRRAARHVEVTVLEEVIDALGFDSRQDSAQGAAIRHLLCRRLLDRDWYSVK